MPRRITDGRMKAIFCGKIKEGLGSGVEVLFAGDWQAEGLVCVRPPAPSIPTSSMLLKPVLLEVLLLLELS